MIRARRREIPLDPLILYYDLARPLPWDRCFSRKGPLVVEIGSGLGEFLIRQALAFPQNNYVGIEQEWERTKKILRKIDVCRKRCAQNYFADNVRILRVDAVAAFKRLFAPRSIDQTFCLFPCPWPKKKHIRHRLFSKGFFRLVNSRMSDGGRVQIVTDHLPFFDWMVQASKGTGFRSAMKVIHPRFNTKFEKKWAECGRDKFYEIQLKKYKHIDVPVEEDVSLEVFYVKEFRARGFALKNIMGDVSIVFKEFLFDEALQKGLVHTVVCEDTLTQHVWIEIAKRPNGWRIAKAEGSVCLPSKGVQQAIASVYKQAQAAFG